MFECSNVGKTNGRITDPRMGKAVSRSREK